MTEVTRQDIMFIDISRENERLRQTHRQVAKLLAHLEGGRSHLMNFTASPASPHPHLPIDFDVVTDPVVAAFQPAYEIITENFERLVDHVDTLAKRISSNEELIAAYHRNEDILIAKLRQQ